MFVLRWILGHPIVSILIFCGLLAVANWGTLYGPGTDAAHVASEEHSGEQVHGDANVQEAGEKAELASTHSESSAAPEHAARADGVVSETEHKTKVSADQATTEEQVSSAIQEPVASSVDEAAKEASAGVAAVAATAGGGAKSLFDFFKGEKKTTTETAASSDISEPTVQSPQVEDVAGDDGKKSVFDFFKKDKAESVEVASGEVEKVVEAVTEQPVATVVEEKRPFLQIVTEEPVAASNTASAAAGQVPQGPAALTQMTAATEPAVVPEAPAAPEVPAQPETPAPIAAAEEPAPQADVPAETRAPSPDAPAEVPVVETVAVAEAPAEMPAVVNQAPALAKPQMVPSPAPRAPQPAPLPSAREAFQGSLLYARRAFWDNQYEASYATYRNLVSAHPNNPDLLGEFGNLLVQMGRTDEAVGVYEHAARILISKGRFKAAHPLVGYIGSVDKQRAMQLVEKIRNAR